MSQVIEVKVPDIGDFKDVPIIDILVQPGDQVKAEDSLITLESDKAAMDVPSPASGVVKEIRVKVGDKVGEGSLVLLLEAAGAAAQAVSAPAAAPAQAATPVAAAPVAISASGAPGNKPYGSPSVRKAARMLGVDLTGVAGTGRRGRILKEDVERYAATGGNAPAVQAASAPAATQAVSQGAGLDLLPWPQVDFAKYGEVEVQARPRIKKISGANLHRNWVMIPHVTQYDEADITALEQFRKEVTADYAKEGIKVTLLAFLIKACVAALQRYPEFNSSLDGDNLVLKHYYNIGFAADTPSGLVVPVIKNADRKGVAEIAKEMSDLAALARDGNLKLPDMQGGTFTISSLGGIGGTAFTPIINAPEVAILGVSRTQTKPVWTGDKFEPRSMLPLSLSYDHRVIDGAAGARFTSFLVKALADIRRVLL